MELLIHFMILGALGGALKVLLHTASISEAIQYDNYKWVMIGGIAGLAYYFLYSDYNFPNSFMALIAGYTGVDFIEAGSRKLSRILRELFKP
jgi:hypothetical protein